MRSVVEHCVEGGSGHLGEPGHLRLGQPGGKRDGRESLDGGRLVGTSLNGVGAGLPVLGELRSDLVGVHEPTVKHLTTESNTRKVLYMDTDAPNYSRKPAPRCKFGRPHFWLSFARNGVITDDVDECMTCGAISDQREMVTSGLDDEIMRTLAASWNMARSFDKPYVVVDVSDNGFVHVVGAYATRSTANGQATRNLRDFNRVFTVVPHKDGGCLAMSGSYVLGRSVPVAYVPAPEARIPNPTNERRSRDFPWWCPFLGYPEQYEEARSNGGRPTVVYHVLPCALSRGARESQEWHEKSTEVSP